MAREALLVVDLEGVAGVDRPAAMLFGTPEYEAARDLLTAEVNAAVEGFVAAGFTHVRVSDSHLSGSGAANVRAEALHEAASLHYLDDWYAEALFDGVEAVACLGMHAPAGSRGFAAHTVDLSSRWSIGRRALSESDLVLGLAAERGTPVVFVSGDDALQAHLGRRVPFVRTKRAVSNVEAQSRAPADVLAALRSAARRKPVPAPALPRGPLRLDFHLAACADAAESHGGKRVGPTAVTVQATARGRASLGRGARAGPTAVTVPVAAPARAALAGDARGGPPAVTVPVAAPARAALAGDARVGPTAVTVPVAAPARAALAGDARAGPAAVTVPVAAPARAALAGDARIGPGVDGRGTPGAPAHEAALHTAVTQGPARARYSAAFAAAHAADPLLVQSVWPKPGDAWMVDDAAALLSLPWRARCPPRLDALAARALAAFLRLTADTSDESRALRPLTLHMLQGLAPRLFRRHRLGATLDTALDEAAAIPMGLGHVADPEVLQARVDAWYLRRLRGLPQEGPEPASVRQMLQRLGDGDEAIYAWLLGELAAKAGVDARLPFPERPYRGASRTHDLYWVTHLVLLDCDYFARPLTHPDAGEWLAALLAGAPGVMARGELDLAGEIVFCLAFHGEASAAAVDALLAMLGRGLRRDGSIADDEGKADAHATATALLAFAATHEARRRR